MVTMFVDREAGKPNRFKVIPENGDPYYVVLERADDVIVPGTPLNANTFNNMLTRAGCVQELKNAVDLAFWVGTREEYEALAEKPNNCFCILTDDGLYAPEESPEHPGCYYNTVDGETEWLNPPMVMGVEYRTTERWQGKAVYTKVIDCGVLPNANYISVRYSNENVYPLRCTGQQTSTVKGNTDTLPFRWNNNGTEQITAIYAADASVIITTTVDMSTCTATAQVWYVKL